VTRGPSRETAIWAAFRETSREDDGNEMRHIDQVTGRIRPAKSTLLRHFSTNWRLCWRKCVSVLDV
jgi:hypothetical protein